MTYAQLEYLLCAAMLVLSMVGMGCTLAPHQFIAIGRAPRPLILVLFAQVILAPILALLLGKLLFLPSGITLGFIVVSSLPGGAFSNLVTYVGRGNVALSISATTFSTLASLFTTAAVLRVFGSGRLPDAFQMPASEFVREVGAQVGLFLLAPLALGLMIRRFGPRRSIPISVWTVRLSLILLGVFVIASLTSGRIRPFSYGLRTVVALFLFFIGSLWLGYACAIWSRYSIHDGFAMAIEVAVRNTGLGLLLNSALFPPEQSTQSADVLYVLLAYSAVSLGMSWFEVWVKRRGIGVLYRPRKRPD